jgi:hypothetical protein
VEVMSKRRGGIKLLGGQPVAKRISGHRTPLATHGRPTFVGRSERIWTQGVAVGKRIATGRTISCASAADRAEVIAGVDVVGGASKESVAGREGVYYTPAVGDVSLDRRCCGDWAILESDRGYTRRRGLRSADALRPHLPFG